MNTLPVLNTDFLDVLVAAREGEGASAAILRPAGHRLQVRRPRRLSDGP